MALIYGHIDPANARIADLMAERNEKDARITELAAELELMTVLAAKGRDQIDELSAELTRYKAPLAQFMRQWESDIQFYNGLDGADLATWAELFRNALTGEHT